MRKINLSYLSWVLVITILASVFPIGPQRAMASGSGTELDPYLIYTADDLSEIRNNLSAHYRLEANIDLASYDSGDGGGWLPIGSVNDTTSNTFTGSLDGNGFTISNMRIDRPTMRAVGLFAKMGGSATLSNIRLQHIQVVGNDTTGGLVGIQYSGTIEQSYATGTVRVTGFGVHPFTVALQAGGLVGIISSGTIENSYAVVDVSGWTRIGGLVGENSGTIRNSYSAGRVNAGDEVGGLVGYNLGTVTNAYAIGSVEGAGLAGGLVGRNDSGGTATNSYWNLDTSGQAGSAAGSGKSSEEMKSAATFGWDPTVWGIVEGLTFPYLRTFGMGIGVDPLEVTMYSLQPGQNAISVTGSVYHESVGELIDIHYIIRDNTGNKVTEDTLATINSDAVRSINRRFSLAGYSNGNYTLTVTATDSHLTAVGITLAFTVDSSAAAPPTVQFTNNDDDDVWVRSASTTVTISDSGGGIDDTSLLYSWSTDTVTPGPNSEWTAFDSGETLTSSATSGEVYLHIRAKDNTGNTANVVSNRFRLDNIDPSITILMVNSDSSEYVNNTWTNQDVTVSQSATDANGVASTDYSVDGGTTWIPYTQAIILHDDGIHSLSFRAIDRAGNETIVHRTIKISASGLMLTPTLTTWSGNPYTSGTWANESVTVSVYAEAGLSGIASLTYSLDGATTQGYVSEDPLLLSQDGQHSIRFDIADEAGNTMTVMLAVYIDMTDPGVSFTMNGSETQLERASTTVTVTDTGSGVDANSLKYAWSSTTVTPTSGWNTFANGAELSIRSVNGDQYLHIKASDTAGNTVNVVSNRFRLYTVTSSQPTVTKHVIDLNGIELNPSTIDLTKSSVTLDFVPKDGIGYVSIPASILTEFAGKNETFILEIKAPYGSYHIPVNLAALIPGLTEILAKSNLKAEDISFTITLSDKSGDKDIQAAFADGLPNGNVLGAIVDFHIDIINTKSGQTIAAADKFSQALTRVIPIPKDVTVMPAQWGAFRYNGTTKKFEFVSAKKEQIDGVWYVMIRSHTNSVYAVATNPVSFEDVQQHWGLPFVQLAAAKGLVEGMGAGKYAPNQAVTRAEFTAMLVRALGRGTHSLNSDGTPYDDVKNSAWYYEEVSYAKELGLLGFVSGKSFKPNQPLTREEMASLLAAAIKLEEHALPDKLARIDGYKDNGSINPAYMADLQLMVTLQIMQGTSSTTLDPEGSTTRAQAAVVFIRTLQTLGSIDR